MNTQELREKYLDYFKSKGHAIISSASLIPENDPTTLFTGSGMQPMVPYLLGEKHPEGSRIADSQKCFRAVDMDEVGDNRHMTFFEMLGNWSLGDYFKKEQIDWMFDFLTRELGLDPKRIYITCFRGKEDAGIPKDQEAADQWKEKFDHLGIDAKIVDNAEVSGMQEGRIFFYDETKNWWSRAGVTENMPVGEPGGPDAEIFWDFGEKLGLHEKSELRDSVCHVNCDCGRFVEIGNNVFMQYIKTDRGFEELTQKNIDFGGGLERMVLAMLDKPDVFLIDIFDSARKKLEELSGKVYGDNDEETKAFRVILDHIRAASFLIADSAVPSNKDQGYFTRRLVRRAVRFAQQIGITESFCPDIARAYIEEYKDAYPELEIKIDFISKEFEKEENKFRATLEQGIKEFEKGTDPFILFTTYGFPFELTEELAKEKGQTIDRDDFEKKMKAHQELSRKGAEQKFKGGLADSGEETTKLHTATHLLHAALRKVLGDHVEQKGSNITADRLRFDFSHGEKMTDEEKKQVEDLVNLAIQKDYPVSFQEMSVDEAKEKGAIGLFGDKYGERVKVYSVGNPDGGPNADPSSDTFSMEICGGPHADHTGSLGTFKIKKEEASSAGVRRIKATLE
ncbi:MAG: alanine--tRNA ligase [Candidatus Magasanikbacteria bacterium]